MLRNKLKQKQQTLSTMDDRGKYVIHVFVKNGQDVFSAYSNSREPMINQELSSFIQHASKSVPLYKPMHIHIKTESAWDDRQKNKTAMALKRYFANDSKELQLQMRNYAIMASVMLMVSILFLWVSIALENFALPHLWLLLIEIAGWVFAWESVDIFCFRMVWLHIQSKRKRALMHAKISFATDLRDTLPEDNI